MSKNYYQAREGCKCLCIYLKHNEFMEPLKSRVNHPNKLQKLFKFYKYLMLLGDIHILRTHEIRKF